MIKQRSKYDNRLEKAVSEFGSLPYCDTPGCPVHETPTSSPFKSQLTKRKDEYGFSSPSPGKPKNTKAAETSHSNNTRNTTLQPKANNSVIINLPPPVFLKITDTHRNQMKTFDDIYPDLHSKLTGEYIKLYMDTDEQRRELIHKLDELKFEYFAITPKAERPIKVVYIIKGLPRDSKLEDIHSDLTLTKLGYTVDKVSQLIDPKTKQPHPIFLVSLPRNIHIANIFILTKVSYMNVTEDGYDGKGITQCYSCNRFHHTTENCHMMSMCLKCGEAHQTRHCQIQRVEKRYCINCETYGHMANYSGCPKFFKPRKVTQVKNNTYTNSVNNIVRPGIFFSYSQAASTSNFKNTQQMTPHDKGTYAALVTNQANQSSLLTPHLYY
ncbi:nucleic-acid-binding protein from transposon X-element [Trichonephila clavipes]|nr:nucleic-acid-binding protein from transposon X-element [Trichonephila clavipes]